MIPQSWSLDKVSSAEIWFHNNSEKSIQAYQTVTNAQNTTSCLEINITMTATNIRSWTKYSVHGGAFKSNITAKNIIAIEVVRNTNESGAEDLVEERTKDEKPFLVIRRTLAEPPARKKRSLNCMDDTTSCCKENFHLNFSEIGWDNWIIQPEIYPANFCRGRCFNDLSITRFYHSAVLLKYIRDNKDLAEEIGLNMCCTPSVMAPITILYRNESDFIYHKTIENMKVEACDCA